MLHRCIVLFSVACLVSCVGVESAGYFTDISAVDANSTAAIPTGVNSSGAVSLMAYTSANKAYNYAYLYTGGTAATLNNLSALFPMSGGSDMSFADSLNELGEMAVNSLNRGYLYSGGTAGTVTQVNSAGGNTFANAVNSVGDVGGATISSGVFTPFVYTGGSVYVLNAPYAGIKSAIASLNSNGQAAGYNTKFVGRHRPSRHVCDRVDLCDFRRNHRLASGNRHRRLCYGRLSHGLGFAGPGNQQFGKRGRRMDHRLRRQHALGQRFLHL